MGSTKRNSLLEIPMATRSSDASAECYGRSVLTWFNEEDQKDAVFFELGTALHVAIEGAIDFDLDLHDTIEHALLYLDPLLNRIAHGDVDGLLQTGSRNTDTIQDDAERMLINWFKFVHPDGARRHPFYDRLEWPPRTEVRFERSHEDAGTRYPVWGEVDAVFTDRDTQADVIVDWKSGTRPPSNDFQLQFYKFGMQKYNSIAAFHMLDRVQHPSMLVLAGEYPGPEIKERIRHTEDLKVETVNSNALPTFNPDWYCDYCPVQDFCPEGGDQRNRNKNRRNLRSMVALATPLDVVL